MVPDFWGTESVSAGCGRVRERHTERRVRQSGIMKSVRKRNDVILHSPMVIVLLDLMRTVAACQDDKTDATMSEALGLHAGSGLGCSQPIKSSFIHRI